MTIYPWLLRKRIDDRTVPSIIDVVEVNNSGTYFSRYNPGTEGVKKVMQDMNHPDFLRRLRRGEVIMGDMIFVRSERSISLGAFSTGPVPDSGGYSMECSGDFASSMEENVVVPNITNSSDLQRMGDIALASAYAKVNQAAMLSGETLRDLNSTISMFRRPFSNAQKLAGRMLRTVNKHSRKTLQSVAQAKAGAWLEYRYGWVPIIIDTENVVDACHRFREQGDRQRFVARASEGSTQSLSKDFADQHIPGIASEWYVSGTVTVEQTVKASAGVMYDLVNRTTLERLNQILGVRPKDLVATVWETIPYSFVLDWFVNVGDWLAAVTPDPTINIVGSWITRKTNRQSFYSGSQLKVVIPRMPFFADHVCYGSMGGSRLINHTVSRDCSPELTSIPVMTMKPLSLLHAIDSVSLLLTPLIRNMRKIL